MTHITSTGADFRHFYAGHPTRKHDPQQHPKHLKMTRKNHLSKLPSKTTPKMWVKTQKMWVKMTRNLIILKVTS